MLDLEDFDHNYELLVEHGLATGCVWVLESSEGIALCPSVVSKNDDVDVMPVWSQPEYAQMHCVDEWKSYEPVPVALEEFLDDWLPGMHDDLTLVGVNLNEDMQGFEAEPLDLLADVEEAAKS